MIALSHERAKDTLIVRGAIRNPSNGTACEMPAVVVLTFDERGIFLGSSESDASGESLPPGARRDLQCERPGEDDAAGAIQSQLPKRGPRRAPR